MEILTVFLYVLCIILLVVVALVLFLLLVPIRYKFDGGFENTLKISFYVRCSPLLAGRGTWNSNQDRPMQVKVVIAGVPFTLHPERWSKNEKEQDKTGEGPSFLTFLGSLDRELIANGKVFLGDLLRILRPDKVEIKGRFGFDEPHLTGWLAAFTGTMEECFPQVRLGIEPVWEEETYECTLAIEGGLVLAVVLYRVARFMLAGRTRRFLKAIKKEKAPSAA